MADRPTLANFSLHQWHPHGMHGPSASSGSVMIACMHQPSSKTFAKCGLSEGAAVILHLFMQAWCLICQVQSAQVGPWPLLSSIPGVALHSTHFSIHLFVPIFMAVCMAVQTCCSTQHTAVPVQRGKRPIESRACQPSPQLCRVAA